MLRYLGALAIVLSPSLSAPATAQTECFGQAPYRVCTSTSFAPNGDMTITSRDTMGNTYSLGTESRQLPGGGQEITSRDSMGNSYSLRSWCDAAGCHSTDSTGNQCTVTRSGQMIGCGQ